MEKKENDEERWFTASQHNAEGKILTQDAEMQQ